MRYKAFISYKHASSGAFAERLELALKSYAKPLWRPPLAIFRDEKYLKPGLDLPQMIRQALDESEYLIYLASPEAAKSSWIKDELAQWCADDNRRRRLIIILTAGQIKIEETSKAIDWEWTDAIPVELRLVLTKVPLYIDCSSITEAERQTLLDPDFKKAVNAIVATFRGLAPIEMSGQEILQYKKNLRNRNLLIAAAIAMLLAAAIGGSIAFQQNQRAAAEARIAEASQLDSEALTAAGAQLPQRALLLAVAAARLTSDQNEPVTAQAEQTLRDLLTATGGYGISGHTGAIRQLFFLGLPGSLLSIGSDGQAILWRLDGEGGADAGTELIAKRGRILSVTQEQETLKLVAQRGMCSCGALIRPDRRSPNSICPDLTTTRKHALRNRCRKESCRSHIRESFESGGWTMRLHPRCGSSRTSREAVNFHLTASGCSFAMKTNPVFCFTSAKTGPILASRCVGWKERSRKRRLAQAQTSLP